MTVSNTQPSSTHPIAYFCAEFALDPALPIYAGGLGILAGDYVLEAAAEHIPMVAVGLWYQQGYFTQHITQSGEQEEEHNTLDPNQLGLKLVTTATNEPLLISVPHHPQPLMAQVWQFQVEQLPVYLLDTNISQNSEADRGVCRQLYSAESTTRLLQELLLGVGGVQLLERLAIQPSIYHLNEGHSALALFALADQFMRQKGLAADQALNQAKQRIVFTNHTIVPAGNDQFPASVAQHYLRPLATAIHISWPTMLQLASDPMTTNMFSMTSLALNGSRQANTVSQRHLQAAETLWPQTNFINVTNGIYLPRWADPKMLEPNPSNQLAEQKRRLKLAMIEVVKQRTQRQIPSSSPIITWARRFAAYKRPNLIVSQPERLLEILDTYDAYVLIAGKAHPRDAIGKEIIAEIEELLRNHNLSERVIFVPNYELILAQRLVSGSDIWLNTPIPGQEASGTSGMKAGANGTLLVSTNDGWMAEVDWADTGWILPDNDPEDTLYRLLNSEIFPLWQQAQHQSPSPWHSRMQRTIDIVKQRFSTVRMLDEYQQKLYGTHPDA